MKGERKDSAEAIASEALGLSPGERSAFVEKRCAGNEALLQEVRSLLSEEGEPCAATSDHDATIAADGSGKTSGKPPTPIETGDSDGDDEEVDPLSLLRAFKESDPGAVLPVESSTEQAGDQVGSYRLLQQIGEGGFGIVWMAEQKEPISRKVALKVIKAGMDTKEVLARFEAERQAVALMDHTHIAKVLDAGATKAGRPWFAMELVKGVPITEFCDQEKLGTRDRLELFRDVCSAINHAHQKGVIHRDIKPSNVMVTRDGDQPVVKVIDFGIAKATQGPLTDKTLFTRFEQLLGTPQYMSPEQTGLSGLDIDTRSDIYALGVLLYELLTGKPPFDGRTLVSAGYEAMCRIIREEEPQRPSLRLSTISSEDETTRITSAHGAEPQKLSRVVRGDLDWIVMKAIEKDRSRRYETANAFAADIGRYLNDEAVEAAAPSAAYRFRKFARRNKAAIGTAALITVMLIAATGVSTWQAIEANHARVQSEEDKEKAVAISSYLIEVFQSPDPARDGRTITVAETLDRAVERLETDLAGQPVVKAALQLILAQTFHSLGLSQESVSLAEAGRGYYLTTFGEAHRLTQEANESLASFYFAAGRLEEALPIREEVLEQRRKVLGPEHPDTLRAMLNLAPSYLAAGRLEEALPMQEDVLELRRKALGPEHSDTLMAMHNLASFYLAAGHLEEALPMQEEVLELRRKVLGPEHPDTLQAMHNLASFYQAAGRQEEGLPMQEEVFELYRKVFGPEHPDTLKAKLNLASFYHEKGRLGEALTMREEVLDLCRKVRGPEHPDTLRAMNNLALSYQKAGRLEEALPMHKEVLELRRKVLGPEHPDTLKAMHNLAMFYEAAGRLSWALRMQEEVLDLRRKVLGPEHPDTLRAMINLASFYQGAGRLYAALRIQEDVLEPCRKVLGREHPNTLGAMHNLAMLYKANGRLSCAVRMQEELLDLRRQTLGPEHPDTLKAMTSLALFYQDAGRQKDALLLKDEVAELRLKVLGLDKLDALMAEDSQASFYQGAGRLREACEVQEKTLALSRKTLGPEHPDTLAEMIYLVRLYDQARMQSKAVSLAKEVISLQEKNPDLIDPNNRGAISHLEMILLEAESAAVSAAGPDVSNGRLRVVEVTHVLKGVEGVSATEIDRIDGEISSFLSAGAEGGLSMSRKGKTLSRASINEDTIEIYRLKGIENVRVLSRQTKDGVELRYEITVAGPDSDESQKTTPMD